MRDADSEPCHVSQHDGFSDLVAAFDLFLQIICDSLYYFELEFTISHSWRNTIISKILNFDQLDFIFDKTKSQLANYVNVFKQEM